MPNRLAREASPYLQQHAHNPVDWYPWGGEALERARREDKPILLSIGYSACHWCHVMERESFESEAIAALMNEWFVSIKVDREERPDLDQIYQLVVQLMGRSGGWPLTVFLTPDQKPVLRRHVLPAVRPVRHAGVSQGARRPSAEAYRTRRDEVDAQAAELAKAHRGRRVRRGARRRAARSGPTARAGRGASSSRAFDDAHGGFGRAPEIPEHDEPRRPASRAARARAPRAQGRSTRCGSGGIYDQLGGGFHRYSTDERWLVPHFEKMLYDNALLLRLYVDGWRATRRRAVRGHRARHRGVRAARDDARRTARFYATQDADSEGEEGKFFVWTPAEVDAACVGDAEAAARGEARCGASPRRATSRRAARRCCRSSGAPADAEQEAALERARSGDVRRPREAPQAFPRREDARRAGTR